MHNEWYENQMKNWHTQQIIIRSAKLFDGIDLNNLILFGHWFINRHRFFSITFPSKSWWRFHRNRFTILLNKIRASIVRSFFLFFHFADFFYFVILFSLYSPEHICIASSSSERAFHSNIHIYNWVFKLFILAVSYSFLSLRLHYLCVSVMVPLCSFLFVPFPTSHNSLNSRCCTKYEAYIVESLSEFTTIDVYRYQINADEINYAIWKIEREDRNAGVKTTTASVKEGLTFPTNILILPYCAFKQNTMPPHTSFCACVRKQFNLIRMESERKIRWNFCTFLVQFKWNWKTNTVPFSLGKAAQF